MEQTLNWGIIIFGNIRITGPVDHYDYLNNGTVDVVINGVRYRVGANNILLKHKEDI